jgi:hypothetical protein
MASAYPITSYTSPSRRLAYLDDFLQGGAIAEG